MNKMLRLLFQYTRMRRRIRNQRKELRNLNKALRIWIAVAENRAREAARVQAMREEA